MDLEEELEDEFEITFEDGELKISREEAIDVIENGEEFEMVPSRRGNNRIMYVGFTTLGDGPYEVGVEFLSETKWHVFHGMDATKEYRNLYGERR